MTTGDQRMVPVRQLKEVADCLEAMATGKGGWAWADVLDDLRAIIDGPGVEPVAWATTADWGPEKYLVTANPNVRDAWKYDNREVIKLYLSALSAPAQAVPDIEEVRHRFEREYVVNKVTARRNEYGDYVLPSIQDAWAGWKAGMLAAQSAPIARCHECGKLASDGWALYCVECSEKIGSAQVIPGETTRDAVRDAVADALGDAYDCTRVWEAWSVGTMGQDDFSLIGDDESRLYEIADAAINVMLAAAPQPPATAQPSVVACPTPAEPKREYTMGDWWSDLDNPHRNR